MGDRRNFLTNVMLAASAGAMLVAADHRGAQASSRDGVAGVSSLWRSWQRNFLQDEGRVTDTGNNNISHSEGQGTALIGAVTMQDRDAFERVLGWTEENLRDQDTGLFHWRFDPAANNPIEDPNNATDGDLMIAWAMWRGGMLWDDPGMRQTAQELADTIYDRLRRPLDGGTVLLPGRLGFDDGVHLTLNLSYAVFPAFRALAEARPEQGWAGIADTFARLIRTARFGKYGLAPDWLAVPKSWDGQADALVMAENWPPRFGYDAIRVPLYLVWGGYEEQYMVPYINFWRNFDGAAFMPDWADLSDDTVPLNDALPGFYAVRRLSLLAYAKNAQPGKTFVLPEVPKGQAATGDENYYSSSLTLLSAMAAAERGMRL